MTKRQFHNQEHTSDPVTAGRFARPTCALLHGQSQPFDGGKHEQTKDEVVRHGMEALRLSDVKQKKKKQKKSDLI